MNLKKTFFVTGIITGLFFILATQAVHAATATITPQSKAALDKAIADANTQATADAADAALQANKAVAANTAGDASANKLAVDTAQKDNADALYQKQIIAEDILKEGGATPQQIAAAQTQVDIAGAALHDAETHVAVDSGDQTAADTAATQSQQDASAAYQDVSNAGTGNFIPLTNLPILNNVTTAPTFPAFFNALYKYAIGLAAAIAFLQIIRAGIMYMGGDSVTETKEARKLIATSLLGLLLVLSPVIVFSIINPKILTLDVGFKALTPTKTTSGTPQSTASYLQGSITSSAPTLCNLQNVSSCLDPLASPASFSPTQNATLPDSFTQQTTYPPTVTSGSPCILQDLSNCPGH